MITIKVKVENRDDRESMVLALANNEYKVWIEKDNPTAKEVLRACYICFEIKEL